jgi:8-oxo-dGTP diphosphatase
VAERFIVNVEVIVERDGKYLLIVRSEEEEFGAGWLSFPGGKLETSTPDMQALELTALRYVESHIFFIGEDPVLDVVMMTSAAIGEPVAVDPREVAGIVWKTPAEILADPNIPEWTQNSVTLSIT